MANRPIRSGGGAAGALLGLVSAETRWPSQVRSSQVRSGARFRVDFVVQRSGDIGSPRSPGSTSVSSAGRSPGSSSAAFLRPPPARRTRPNGPVRTPVKPPRAMGVSLGSSVGPHEDRCHVKSCLEEHCGLLVTVAKPRRFFERLVARSTALRCRYAWRSKRGGRPPSRPRRFRLAIWSAGCGITAWMPRPRRCSRIDLDE